MRRPVLQFRRTALAAFLLLIASAGVSSAFATPLDGGNVRAQITRARDDSVDTLISQAEHAHPIVLWLLAKRLYDMDRRDEAVFWFYAGQLRWRACLIQDRDCAREPFGRLFETIGPDLNQHAFRELPAFLAMIDAVLAWDAAHHDDYVSDRAAKEQARQGMTELAEYTRANAEQLRVRQEQLAREAAARGDDPYGGDGGALFGMPQELLTSLDERRFARFRAGVAIRADILREFGRPEMWSTEPDGASTFTYSFLRSTEVSTILGMSERVLVSMRFDAAKVLTAIQLPRDR